MPIPIRKSSEEFTPCPEGLFNALCVDVVDMGLMKSQYGDKFKIKVVWQVEETNPENEDKRFTVRQFYTNSDNEKSNLRKMLESWRGQKFTQEQMDNFDVESVVGAPCQVQVVHNLGKEGKTFANAQAVVPAAGGVLPLEPNGDYIRECDRPTDVDRNSNGTRNAGLAEVPPPPDDEDGMPF